MPELAHAIRDRLVRRLANATRSSRQSHDGSILIIQPDHLGDVLLSQPAVRAIRHQYSDRHIVGVVGPWSEQMATRCWDVNDLVTFPFPAFDRNRSRRSMLAPYTALADAVDVLSPFDPESVYILRPDDWWSAWVASMISAGDVVTARDKLMEPFATRQIDLRGINHAAARALAIASFENCAARQRDVEIAYPENTEAARQIDELLEGLGVPNGYMVVHPGAGAEVKTWPVARWRTVVRHLADLGHHIVVTRTEADTAEASAIIADVSGATAIAGRTDLDGLAEVLRQARVVVGPDSGPLHLAVACKTPTVHLFGPSEPEKFGPWGPEEQHRVVTSGWSCSRCGDLSMTRAAGCGCMLAIEPDAVLTAVQDLIESNAA